MPTSGVYYGIDIGTGNCSVAWVVDSPRMRQQPLVPVQVVGYPTHEAARPDRISPRFPSVALVPASRRSRSSILFGWEAVSRNKGGFRRGEDLFYSVKSDLGTNAVYDESVTGAPRTPVEVTARVLSEIIEAVLKEGLPDPRKSRTVITVPASFAGNQRSDIVLAASLAGLTVEEGDLLDEPVAALLDLCNSADLDAKIRPHDPTNLMVFDFGAGTCDIAVLRVQYAEGQQPLGLSIQTLGIGPYERFGGDNLDRAIMERVAWPKVCAHHHLDDDQLPEELKARFIGANLWRVGRELKEMMCNKVREGSGRASGRFTVKARTVQAELDGTVIPPTIVSMTQQEFEDAIGPFIAVDTPWTLFADDLVETTLLRPVQETLKQAELDPGDVDFVILNGGSCHNPYVRRCLEQWGHLAGAQILEAPDLDTSVARGAALQCYWRGARRQTLVVPVANEEIGVATREQDVPVLSRGAPLPYPPGDDFVLVDASFSVPQDDLAELAIPIYAGRGERRRTVGTARVELAGKAPVGTPVQVEVRVDANRINHWRFRVLADNPAEGALTVTNPWVNRMTRPEERDLVRVDDQISETFLRTGRVPLDLKLARAGALRKAGDLLKAKGAVEAVLRVDPNNASAHNLLGLTWGELNKHERSFASHETAAALCPEEPIHVGNCGAELVQLSRPREAIERLQQAIATNPNLHYCHTWLGYAYRGLGDEERAEKEFRRSAQMLARRIGDSPRPLAEDYRSLAHLQRLVGDYEEADRCDERAREVWQQDFIGADPLSIVSSLDLLDLLGEASDER